MQVFYDIRKEENTTREKVKSEKYVMYLDESGIADRKNTGTFTLVGCIIRKKDIKKIDEMLKTFKMECFANENLILHLMDIRTRRNNFAPRNITKGQIQYFNENVHDFLKNIEFMIISTTVDKKRLNEYYKTPKDEYSIAFSHIMKSVYHFLSNDMIEQLDIYFESREETLNFKVQKSFFESYYSGGVHLDVLLKERDKIKRFVFKDKNENIAGLQIVDLICGPIKTIRTYGTNNKSSHKDISNDIDIFNAIKGKFYNPLEYQDIKNWSLKKVPIIKKPGVWEYER